MTKGINFLEGFLLLCLLLIIDALLTFFLGGLHNVFIIGSLLTAIPYFICFWIIRRWKSRFNHNSEIFRPPILGFIFITSALFFLTTFLLEFEAYLRLGIENYVYTFNEERGLNTNFIEILIVIPIVEELFFRGILFRGFRNKYGQKSAIIFSSILFALIHIELNSVTAVSKILSAFSLGILQCYVVIYTKSLKIAILIHVLWNLLNYFKGIAIVIFDIYIIDIIDFILFAGFLILGALTTGFIGVRSIRFKIGSNELY
jgi:membrane protease YdiL (CAAX protease family)